METAFPFCFSICINQIIQTIYFLLSYFLIKINIFEQHVHLLAKGEGKKKGSEISATYRSLY